MKRNKKPLLIGALAVLLAVLVVGGTVAWLTAANSVTNTFTVGQINPPKDDTEDDNKPDDPPEPPGDGEHTAFDGNIYEILDDDMKIIPGKEITKKPYIGIGANSEDAYVFAYVANNMTAQGADAKNSSYFTLNDGWVGVKDNCTEYVGEGAQQGKTYTGGLFKWVGTTPGASDAAILESDNDTDEWITIPVFNSVNIPDSANASDFVAVTEGADPSAPTMAVWCFLYAAVSPATSFDAESAAIAWATADGGPTTISGVAATTNGD